MIKIPRAILLHPFHLVFRAEIELEDIIRSDPIFHTDRRVLFNARWFCWRSDRSFPNKVRWHSSNKLALLEADIWIPSSSSLVSYRFCSPSNMASSITSDYNLTICRQNSPIHSKQKPIVVHTMGERRSYLRETTTPLHKRETNSYRGKLD